MTPQFRHAVPDDLEGLALLERSASVRALGHIFPPDRYPYPLDDVRRRWRDLLIEPTVHVGVADSDSGLAALVAFDEDVLRHLAVRPDLWGSGLARTAITWAAERAPIHRLWCLEQNDRALGLYAHLGWTPTGRRQRAEFPPYPVEVELIEASRAERDRQILDTIGSTPPE